MTHRIWRRSNDPVFRAATVLVVVAVLAAGRRTFVRATQARDPLRGQIAALSEPDGYFDTDNLISNERSYLEVLPELERRNVRGGAYIGVGPDQNFSYIAHIRPSVAFILDIRRDNLLLHLLFKALFQAGANARRVSRDALWTTVPTDLDSWRASPVSRLVEYINGHAFGIRSRSMPRMPV